LNTDYVLTKDDSESVVEEAKAELKEPLLYQVVMLNDDFTPMEFVVAVLEMFFNKDRETATRIMQDVHNNGKASCGVYTKDVAETKAEQVMNYARRHEHPLFCSLEEI
jgi:ATP-dependent Clp protease adaptor protein ClpS